MSTEIKRTMGLPTAVCMLVGCIVGASIFIVPGQLASTIGPGVIFAYLLGGLMVIFKCFEFAQIGCVLPVPAANYQITRKCLGETMGNVYLIVFILTNVILAPIMAKTAAQYIGQFFPNANQTVIAYAIILITGLLNMASLSLSSKVQNVLVVIFIGVILIFFAGSMTAADFSHFSPMFPNGVSPVIVGALSTYFTFSGFYNMVELSGDIKNPGKNIPRMIIISFIVILVIYMAMIIGMVALVAPSELNVDAPAIFAAKKVFPSAFLYAIGFASIAASWTTVNAVTASTSRVIYSMGESGSLPKGVTKLNKSGTPYIAVIIITILEVIAVALSMEIIKYVNITSVYLLLTAIISACGSLKLKDKLKAEYDAADYKLKGFWYYFWPIGSIVTSIFFVIVAFRDDFKMSVIAVVLIPIILAVIEVYKRLSGNKAK